MSLADDILGLVWLFPRGDNRKDDIRTLAALVRALESDLVCAVNLIDDRIRPPRFDHLVSRPK